METLGKNSGGCVRHAHLRLEGKTRQHIAPVECAAGRSHQARSIQPGDHIGAQEETTQAESITRVLYPSDATPAGQELRLRQEYFFTSASLQDLLRRHVSQYGSLLNLAEKAAIQLNDTHPAIAIAELMRLLIDEHHIAWEKAWEITRATTAYTNHTLLPEALESWPVHLIERLLPRHMQIVYAINAGIIADAHKKRDGGFRLPGSHFADR